MRLTVDRIHARDAVESVSRASASTMPILDGILLDASGDTITFRCSNLEAEIETTIPARVDHPGRTVAPSKLLRAILANSDADELSISCDQGLVTIRSGRAEFELATMPANDFPPALSPPGTTCAELRAADLSQGISRVLHAVSTERARPALTGVRIILSGSTVTLAATDGARLAITSFPAHTAPESPTAFTVPAGPAQWLRRLADQPDDLVRLQAGDQVAQFHTARTRLSTRLLDPRFPAFSHILQRASEASIAVSDRRDALISAVRLATLAASRDSKTVLLEVREDVVVFSAREAAVSKAESQVWTTAISGKELPIQVALNGSYLAEALSQCSDTVTLMIESPSSPILIRSGDGRFDEVLAPVRIR
jgi:DNA polymerase-3 subunit beta